MDIGRWLNVDLAAELKRLLRQVPAGKLTTFGALARALGDVRAAAWVAKALRSHAHTATCACHRVLRQSGELSTSQTDSTQRQQLIREGWQVTNRRVLEATFLTAEKFQSTAPLTALQGVLADIAADVSEQPLPWRSVQFCGLDVAYPQTQLARAAAVLMDADTLEVQRIEVAETRVEFPYIPGYLTFRELPPLLAVWRQMEPHVDSQTVCFVDGNGRLHPRRAGIACAFGVATQRPTVGIGKSLLCGRVSQSTATPREPTGVIDRGEIIGHAVCNATGCCYVSVGNGLSLADACRLAIESTREGRLPAPIVAADRQTRRRC
jgi:deoxyribonuclease V